MTEAPPRSRGRPFAKGQSGNPGGRPPAPTFAAVLREQLAAERGKQTTREMMAGVVVEKALRGDLAAIQWIVDRTDGKVTERLEATVDASLGLTDATIRAVLAYAAGLGRSDAGPP